MADLDFIAICGVAAFCSWIYWKKHSNKRKSQKIAITYGLPKDSLPFESVEDTEFVVDNEDPARVTIDLDVDLNLKSLTNHFRLYSRYDTVYGKRLYEYRVDGTDVYYRLIEDRSDDIGRPEERDVLDGVVQESAIRERSADKTVYVRSPEEKITELKCEVEWHKMDSWGFRGFKYFLLSKKLARREARRFLRQELERMKLGTAGFFKEAKNLNLEQDDDPLSLERLRFSEGKPRPTNEQIKALYESTESFGITYLEFSWGKRLTGLLERLLE